MLFHVPWYNSNKAHQGEGASMMAAMEPLLYAAGADIVICGHVHAYERSVSSLRPIRTFDVLPFLLYY